ncbi:hypothetical protein HYZ80_00290 [Candidatus Parcubacteria bacterium]|nr:hypothetical protein [Candidatus Parcubacteria bacterium]
MAELKEAFVQGRFAEEPYYGTRHIEKWLVSQRKARQPDEGRWNHCLCSDRMIFCLQGRELPTLIRYADPSLTIPEPASEYSLELEHWRRIAPLLRSLDPAKAQLYYGHVFGTIAVCGSGPTAPAYVFVQEHDANGKAITVLKPLVSLYAMDAIYATWRRGGPKAEAAREFLCNELAREIATVRAEAGADFDRAVAVSADGRKIVHADWVVVPGPLEEKPGVDSPMFSGATVFRGDAFHERKILRFCLRRAKDSDSRKPTPEIVVLTARHTDRCHSEQSGPLLIEVSPWSSFDRSGGYTVLMASRELCPDPLPDGGVEVSLR